MDLEELETKVDDLKSSSKSVFLRLPLSTVGIVIWAVFLVLKLTGPLASLDWFWVWFPFWIVPAVKVGGILLLALIFCVAAAVRRLAKRISRR